MAKTRARRLRLYARPLPLGAGCSLLSSVWFMVVRASWFSMACSVQFQSAWNVDERRKFCNQTRAVSPVRGGRRRSVHNSCEITGYRAVMDNFRLDKLHVKLFAAIAGAVALLTVAAYFIFTASFEYGFIQYLKRADEVRLERMSERLAEGYRARQGWSWIADDRERWIDMSREALGLASATAEAATGARPPQRDTPLTIDPRLMLFDAERRLVMGRSDLARAAQFM